MLQLLAQENLPEGMSDIIFVPLVLTVIGVLFFYAGLYVETRRGKAPWKWLALLPIAAGLYIGFGFLYRWMFDTLYHEAVVTGAAKRMFAAHWGGFLIPVLGVIAIVVFQMYGDKLNLTPTE
jgi:hypothetical protein